VNFNENVQSYGSRFKANVLVYDSRLRFVASIRLNFNIKY